MDDTPNRKRLPQGLLNTIDWAKEPLAHEAVQTAGRPVQQVPRDKITDNRSSPELTYSTNQIYINNIARTVQQIGGSHTQVFITGTQVPEDISKAVQHEEQVLLDRITDNRSSPELTYSTYQICMINTDETVKKIGCSQGTQVLEVISEAVQHEAVDSRSSHELTYSTDQIYINNIDKTVKQIGCSQPQPHIFFTGTRVPKGISETVQSI
eukprot:gb/GEZN01014605.1/.p1 GENE.gb/GEZN01014605.1/~~gb/GEZN01014605.1/.p1  ORF type:complete len:210 (-),score=7.53 gb/GEZN01014605.1/:83-712(-)